ncbi:MAG: nuclear transport factor 2 family protein [Alphaproteobacteria bacterium]
MTEIDPRIARWKAAWEGFDPAAVAALYLPDGTHASAKVAAALGDGRTALTGQAEIADYARRAFARYTRLDFRIVRVLSGEGSTVVEYDRYAEPGPAEPMRVAELFEWAGERVAACRVYHF